MPSEELTLKDYNIDHAYTDGCICDIEDIVEEGELLTACKGQPIGEMSMYQWKIEHVDHSAM